MIAIPMFRNRSGYRIRLTDLFLAWHITFQRFTRFTNTLKERPREMANRKGVFIGAYVPNHLKESLRRRAAAEHRTLSQEITRILEEAVHGKGLPPAASIAAIANRLHAAGPQIRRRAGAMSTLALHPRSKRSSDDNS